MFETTDSSEQRCPNCGKSLYYDTEFLLWRCKNCRRIYTYQELEGERVHHKVGANVRDQTRPKERVRYAPPKSRPAPTTAKTKSVKHFLGQILALAGLILIVLLIASTVSMLWPQGIVKVVPEELDILHILPTRVDIPTTEQTIFLLVNEERQETGLAPLTWNDELAQYSRKHSTDMVKRGDLYHDKAELAQLQAGENAIQISKFCGGLIFLPYPIGLAIYRTHSELCQDSVKAWMESPGHRSNILEASYTYTGVGVAVAEDGITCFITQDFRR